MSHRYPFRQIHLDFHNSEHIPAIGNEFDPEQYVAQLRRAHVDGVVTFAKCHHGWSYYDTKIGARHPNLGFDLLQAQYEACRAADIQVPIYVSVGWDERAARRNPGWRQIQPDGTFRTLAPLGRNLQATWSYMCLNTPYLDELCEQIGELADRFSEADGFWLDIASQAECCCAYCRQGMDEAGLDWTATADRQSYRRRIELNYLERTHAAARRQRADMPVFHNMGHVRRGDRAYLSQFSHADVESLPTGGWGYDHGPLTARYLDPLQLPQAGLTGRFHTVWGEFAGYKHPNALRHECAVMLAHGQRCVIGDQLDPSGALDEDSLGVMAPAFEEVRAAETVCEGSRPVSEIGLLSALSSQAGNGALQQRECLEDEGAVRLLLEGHHAFDVLDSESDFGPYRLIILPDRVRVDAGLTAKLHAYVASGGSVLASAGSAVQQDGRALSLPLEGCEPRGTLPYEPLFVEANEGLKPDFVDGPVVFYGPAMQWDVVPYGPTQSLGLLRPPYFNRSPRRFSGHQHTAPAPKTLTHPAILQSGRCLVFAHAVFTMYRQLGTIAHKQIVLKAIDRLLGGRPLIRTDLPSTARVTLRRLPDDRFVLHVTHAIPVLRGQTLLGPLEVIEELPRHSGAMVSLAWPLPGLEATGHLPSAEVWPSREPVDLKLGDGRLQLQLPEFEGGLRIVLSINTSPLA